MSPPFDLSSLLQRAEDAADTNTKITTWTNLVR